MTQFNLLDDNINSGIGVLDPNSNFYKWNKRNFPIFNMVPESKHLITTNYNPNIINENYKDMYAEKHKYSDNKGKFHDYYNDNLDLINPKDRAVHMVDIDKGFVKNQIYYTVKDLNIDMVGIKFFSVENLEKLQKLIKQIINIKSNGKIILECDQNETDLLVAMRNIYVTEGRYLPENINKQVNELNKQLLNKIVPDMITQVKQSWGYQRDINEPLRMLDRPISDTSKGRKLLPSNTTIWNR